MKISGFMRKNNGVISLFLAVIMLSMFVLSGVIVEGARLRQAVAIVQSAADSAAMSVLAKYDKGLYDRYGLFVMDEETQANIQSDYMNFFMANLSASLPDEDSLNSLFTKLASKFGYKNFEECFDIYDFQEDTVNVNPVYSIGSPEILQLQTTEVAKYRSAFLLLQDITGMGDDLAKESEQQQKDVALMQESLDYREGAQDIAKRLAEFTQTLFEFYDGGDASNKDSGKALKDIFNTNVSQIDTAYSAFENKYNETVTSFTNLKNSVTAYNSKVQEIVAAAQDVNEREEAANREKSSLEMEKGTIQFDETADDYDEAVVESWNQRKEDNDKEFENIAIEKTRINREVVNLSGKLDDVNQKITNYNNCVNALSQKKTELVSKISSFITQTDTWISKIDEYINNWSELLTEVDNSLADANDHKGTIASSGASDEVQESANKDADDVIKSLTAAKNSKADEKLNKTKTYIEQVKNNLESLKTYVDNARTDTKSFSIVYETADGSISSASPDWTKLSKITQTTENVVINPSNFFNSEFTNKFNLIKKPNGKEPFPSDVIQYYKYETGVTHSTTATSSAGKQLESLYKENKGKNIGNDSDSEDDKTVTDSQWSKRPSANQSKFKISDSYSTEDTDYFNYIVNKYKAASMPMVVSGSGGLSSGNDSMLEGFGSISIGEEKSSQSGAMTLLDGFLAKVKSFFNGAQYDVMTYVYTMSMFKNRLSKKPSEWKSYYDNNNVDRDSKYYVERDTENADLNLMLDHQFGTDSEDELKTMLNSEIEYILWGKQSDKSNRKRVWATIYGIRLGNNLIAVYCNEEIRDAASAVAETIAAAAASLSFGFGGLLAPLIEFAIIAVVAALETYQDMKFLVDDGYKIPFIKTSKNLNYSLDNLSDGDVSKPNTDDTSLFIKYEDYLLIFLLFTNQEKVLYRTADLIQYNMALQTGTDYDLSNKYTYIRAKNTVTIKPFMINYAFMPDDIRNDNRFPIETLIYQGY